MIKNSLSIAPILLNLGVSTSAFCQEVPNTSIVELDQYRATVRGNIARIISPFGLKYERVNGTGTRYHHIGYPLGQHSKWSIGINYERNKMDLTVPLSSTGRVNYGVNFILKNNFL